MHFLVEALAMTPKILIIDDDDLLLSILALSLRTEGADVMLCPNPLDAQRIAEEYRPDLIIVDVYMEPINGFAVASILKRSGKTSDIPIVFVTADVNEENITNAFMVGGVDVVEKPFDIKGLLKRIQPYLGMGQVHNLIKNIIGG
jgi:DNA-binding response OmpR family regulator